MLILATPTDTLQVHASTTAVAVHVSFVDLNMVAGALTPGRQNSTLAIDTRTTVVVAPATGLVRNVKTFTVMNTSPTTPTAMEVFFNENGVLTSLVRMTLGASQTLAYAEDAGFYLASPRPFRLGQTWGLVGDLSLLTTLPSMFVSVMGTQIVKLSSFRAKIASGTSIGAQVKRNGTNVGGVITVTPTVGTSGLGDVVLANNDEITLLLSTPVGTPMHLSATLTFEHTP
jgi:hypothetical protein